MGTSTPVCLSVQAPHPKGCCTKPALDWGGSWSLLVTRRGRGAGYPLGTNTLYAPRPSPRRPPPSHTHRPQATITLSQPRAILEASGLSIARVGPTARSGSADLKLCLAGAGESWAWGHEGRGRAGLGVAMRWGHWGGGGTGNAVPTAQGP